MAEVTRVPLQPIEKGSLAKLWLGILVLLLAGAAIAYLSVPRGVTVTVVTEGAGGSPSGTDVVLVNYVGKLTDGTVFDQGKNTPLPLNRMLPGFSEGLQKMEKGGKYTLQIPAEKAYGPSEQTNPNTGEVVIPANSDLVFDIDLLDFMSGADFERRMQMQQQLMEMQQKAEKGDAAPQ
jgi:FKBP-type peptidyl-prolyl cis-trans isomerase FkpA